MGQIRVEGRLTCQTDEQAEIARTHLPEHIRLSREEPGNIRFDVIQQDNAMTWQLFELFESPAAFAAHQERTRNSAWGRLSRDILRDFTVYEEKA